MAMTEMKHEVVVHQQWYAPHQMDERDGFITWIRGEFAAANAIIDALCHHLRLVGDSGEYDGVIGCIQQRRCNWNPVLHMQQYFSVAEVIHELNQVGWRKHPRGFDGGQVKVGKEYRRGGSGRFSGRGDGGKIGKDGNNRDLNANAIAYVGENVRAVEDSGSGERLEEVKYKTVCVLGVTTGDSEGQGADAKKDCGSNLNGSGYAKNESLSSPMLHEEVKLPVTPKTFACTELYEGQMVNVADGMKLYEELFDDSEVSKLVTLVKNLQAAGRKGRLQGQTYIVSRRPMRGHGREMIQFGLPIADASLEDEAAGPFKERKIEPIPGLLQDVIEQLVSKQIVSIKPDSCIIDIFDEGDFSHPYMWSRCYGRPVSVLFLTECDMTFGKIITSDNPGDYQGSVRLSLATGSLLVMQGKSSDFSKHAIPSLRKQRIFVTLTKSQPKKIASDGQRYPSPSHWVPPIRSPNHIRHPMGLKHYGQVPATGVLPAPAVRPQLALPNGAQPIFVPAQVAPGFAAPVALPPDSAGWSAPPARQPPPRLPVPGTGVFFPPPGSGNASDQILMPTQVTTETSSSSQDNGSGLQDGNSSSPKGKTDEEVQQQGYGGTADGNGNVAEDEDLSIDTKEDGKPARVV